MNNSMIISRAKELRRLLEYVTENLDDSVALEVATFVKRWKPNTDYKTGDRVSYKPGEEVELFVDVDNKTSDYTIVSGAKSK